MGRSRRLLKHIKLDVRQPARQRCNKAISSFWAADLNERSIDSVCASTEEQCYFIRLCGEHTTKQTPKSLLQNFTARHGTSLDCKICRVYNREKCAAKPSSFESVAYSAVSSLPGHLQVSQQLILVDHRVLGGDCSAVDIYLTSFDLCIMIDGEGHFRQHRETTSYKQNDIDSHFNTEALRLGHKVLRLHYGDVSLYHDIVRIAVDRCSRNVYGTIDFSKSYGDDVRKIWGLALLKSNCK